MLKDGKWKVLTATDTSWSGRESGYSDIGNWCALQFGGERVDGRIVPTEFSTYSLDKMKCILFRVIISAHQEIEE